MSTNQDMGELKPDVAAELNEAIIGHQVDHVELEAATAYRTAVVARAEHVMRSRGCSEDRITAMAASCRAEPLGKWIKALYGDADEGPWDD